MLTSYKQDKVSMSKGKWTVPVSKHFLISNFSLNEQHCFPYNHQDASILDTLPTHYLIISS